MVLAALLISFAPTPSAAAAGEKWCPPQSAPYCSANAFLEFWKNVDVETGGYALDIIGFPISPALQRPSDGLIVQFYERAIFEWHPEKERKYQVLLTRLGAFAIDVDTKLDLKNQRAKAPVPCDSANTCVIFGDTNHTLRGAFLQHWWNNGRLPVYGFPLTEQFQLRFGSTVLTVQYFERNRFEAHPEKSDPRYQVLLGRLGAEELSRHIDVVKTWQVVATPNYMDMSH